MLSKWQRAQLAEKDFWAEDKERIISKEWLETKRKMGNRILEWCSKFVRIRQSIRILQVGAGPEGIINFFPVGRKYAIDPLADFFKDQYNEIVPKDVNFTRGKGECLPYEDNFFDIVINRNVLDHTEDPQKVLSQTKRVLKTDGILCLEVHVYGFLGYLKKKWTDKDTLHPHTFNKLNLKRLVTQEFQILDTNHDKKIHMYIGTKKYCLFYRRRYNRYILRKKNRKIKQ